MGLLNLEIHVLFLERASSFQYLFLEVIICMLEFLIQSSLSLFFHMFNCFIVLCFILEDFLSYSF